MPDHRPDIGPCWLWTGSVRRDGRGKISSKHLYVHRLAYEISVGPIPEGLELDHLCRVRHCCNPLHLEPVTHATNMERGHWRIRTHCPAGHPYDAENTYVRPNGDRECRECRSASLTKHYEKIRKG